jgi:hypothetical protein
MESYFYNCVSAHTEESNTGKTYWKEQCAIEAKKIFCKKDTFVLYGKKVYKYSETPKRIQNKIENISR